MLFEIIFCFFTVFGIVQFMALIRDMFFSKMPQNCAVVVNVDENTDVRLLASELDRKYTKIVFVYDNINEKKLEILEKSFQYASFVMRDKLTDEILRLI